jgi:trk system potassium uptake protein TrkH
MADYRPSPRKEDSVKDFLQRKFTFAPTLRQRVDRLLKRIFIFSSVAALVGLVVEYGFYPDDFLRTVIHVVEYVVILIFALIPLVRLVFTHHRLSYLKEHLADFILLAVYVIYLIATGRVHSVATDIWSGGQPETSPELLVGQMFIAANLILHFVRGNRTLTSMSESPVRFIVFSFLAVIGTGTLLLSLPRATVAGSIHPIDALFTSTSATCVTGLIVLDTGADFTRFGQGVIMSLIQIGGLGLMSFTAFFSTMLGIRVNRKEVALYSKAYEADTVNTVRRLLVYMLLATLLIELLGFGLLYQTWEPGFPDKSELLFSSAFHSVSAFCNAGFSLNSTSMEAYTGSTGTNLIISTLIILGGLGFIVLMNLTSYRFKPKKGRPRSRLTLQTKLVLVVSAVLIVVGWLMITPLEWNNSFDQAGLGFGEKVMAGYFQSVTTRTAGFNTVTIGNMLPGTIFVMIVLMFIGASPGSTGGGIKTSTFAVIILNFWADLRGRNHVEAFKREIPTDVTRQALAVLVGAVAFCVLGFFLLLLFEDQPPLELLFETVSAYATVGLSTGVTPHLSYAGRLVIILLMFAGRVGPLSLGLAIGRKHIEGRYRYPEGRISIG